MVLHFIKYVFLLSALAGYKHKSGDWGVSLRYPEHCYYQKKTAVPNLLGMTYKDAKKILGAKKIEVRAVVFQQETDTSDLDNMVVVNQRPKARSDKGIQNYFNKQKLMDVWIVSQESPADTLPKQQQQRREIIKPN